MAEIVNLRRVRKQKARDEAAQQAAANRVRSGMTKAEREAERARRDTESARLDGAKLQHGPPPEPPVPALPLGTKPRTRY